MKTAHFPRSTSSRLLVGGSLTSSVNMAALHSREIAPINIASGSPPPSSSPCLEVSQSLQSQAHSKSSEGFVERPRRNWTIGEVAGRPKVKASTIRPCDSVGLLPNPPRSGGWCLDRLRIITAARDLGFSLAKSRRCLMASLRERPLPPAAGTPQTPRRGG